MRRVAAARPSTARASNGLPTASYAGTSEPTSFPSTSSSSSSTATISTSTSSISSPAATYSRKEDNARYHYQPRSPGQYQPKYFAATEEEDRLEYGWGVVAGWAVGAVLLAAMATWAAFACAYAGEAASRERACQRLLVEAQAEAIRCHEAAVLRAVTCAKDSHTSACSELLDEPHPDAEPPPSPPPPCSCPSALCPSVPVPSPHNVSASPATEDTPTPSHYPWWPPEEQPHVTTASSTGGDPTASPNPLIHTNAPERDNVLHEGGPDPGFRPLWKGSLGFFPNRTTWDPYQSSLYMRGEEFGLSLLSKEQMWNLTIGYEHPKHRKHYRYVFHLHWVAMVCTKDTMEDAIKELRSVLDFFQWIEEQGWYIVWTVHHVIDPSCTPEHYPLQIQLLQNLTERADVIHVFCPQTVELAAPYFRIAPEKVVTVPQGSYVGLYSDVNLTQLLARRTLSLHTPFVSDGDDLVLLYIGSIKRYKGLAELVQAFNAVSAENKRMQLWIVGEISTVEQLKYSDAQWMQIEAAINANSAIRTWYGRVHDDDLQFYYKAADVVVLPYPLDSVLSSGTLLTSLSFGRPVIAPPLGCMDEWLTEDTGIVFSPHQEEKSANAKAGGGEVDGQPRAISLEDALRQAHKLRAESYRQAALAKAQRYTYRDMSGLFFEKLKWRI